jgi:replication factor C large subunit
MVSWVRKYSPKTLREVVGQDAGVQQLKDFVLNFKKQKKGAMLIYGPSGVGKTCAVHSIAHDSNLEIIEVNASDVRNEEQITAILGNAIKQQSLFHKGKIILVDEIDGLSGQEDRGGAQALAKIIDSSSFPIVLTANNPWNSKFSTLRSKSLMVQFHPLNYLGVFTVLKKICTAEKLKASDNLLKSLARRAGGDLRAAINDLQSLAEKGNELGEEGLEGLSERNRIESIMQALVKIFKTTQPDVALAALDNVEEDLDTSLLWVDENLPKEYTKPQDLARAYESLARADIFRGRIRRWQYWRFLVYVNALMTAGVALGKDEKYHSFVSYTPTTRILKIWQANMKYQKRKAIAAKMAEQMHTSSKEVLKSMPYVKVIFKKNKAMAEQIADELDLDKEEVEWLRK